MHIPRDLMLFLCIFITIFSCIESMIKIKSYRTKSANKDFELIIFDLKTDRELTSIIARNTRAQSENASLIQLPDSWNPCACLNSSCMCCVGIRLGDSFNNRLCISLQYRAIDLALQLQILHNSRTVAQFGFSARNPPAYCLPILAPLPIFACMRFFNIRALGGNLQVCLALLLNVLVETIFELHFDCIRFGLDGVLFMKREQIELDMSLEGSNATKTNKDNPAENQNKKLEVVKRNKKSL